MTTAGELQKIVASRGQKTLKRLPTSPHVVWEGFIQKQTPAYSVVRHDGTSNGTGLCGQMRLKK